MMTEHPRIVIDTNVLAGKPVLRGTRLSVEFVIGLLAEGWAEADILSNYPGLTRDDILSSLAYARDTLSSEKVFPSAAQDALFADEYFPRAAVVALQAAGHDVVWIRIAAPDVADFAILAQAEREQRILLTFDKDFGELAAGQCLATLIAARDDWAGHFSVIEPGRVRMRRLG